MQRSATRAIACDERHRDRSPDRVEHPVANVYDMQLIGACGIDIGLQLRTLRIRCRQFAVVHKHIGRVLKQAEVLREEELQLAACRQGAAQQERFVVRQQRIHGLPETAIRKVYAAAIQRHRASRADVAVDRSIHPGQIRSIDARQQRFVGLRQRVKDIGPFLLPNGAEVGELQGVLP